MSFNKSGVVSDNCFAPSIISKYDRNYYMEPDGSIWIRIFHHGNPANGNLFSTSDSFTTSVYKDSNRWFQVSIVNKISGTWELMIKQKQTSSSREEKYRWTQKTNPMSGSYSDVSPSSSNIVRNTSSGYTVNTASGGMYKLNGSSYLVIANTSNGNWYGAVGSFSAYGGGIPGFPNTAITTGYMDLYLRIDSLINSGRVSITKEMVFYLKILSNCRFLDLTII